MFAHFIFSLLLKTKQNKKLNYMFWQLYIPLTDTSLFARLFASLYSDFAELILPNLFPMQYEVFDILTQI